MKNNNIYTGVENVDRIFRALGDPHRIRIIELLREKELSAGEILKAIDVVQSTLSHHMKTLSDSGAVNAVRRGKWTYYSLNKENLALAAAFLEECANGTMTMKNGGTSVNVTDSGVSKVSENGSTRAVVNGSGKTVVKGPGKTAVKEPEKTTVKTPGKTSENAPGKTAVKGPAKTAVKEPEKAAEKAGKKKDKKNKKGKKNKK